MRVINSFISFSTVLLFFSTAMAQDWTSGASVDSTSETSAPSTIQKTEQYNIEAKKIVAQFVGELKPALKKAIQVEGPIQAISVCADKAPLIAQSLSEETQWKVKRVSLKTRNKTLATPDDWETTQLKYFDERQKAGEPAIDINSSEMQDNTYRYLQAQGVESLCLTCHGENISPDIREALLKRYPDDTATGYTLGEIRGGISLTKILN